MALETNQAAPGSRAVTRAPRALRILPKALASVALSVAAMLGSVHDLSAATPFDFDGDGRADLAVFRPSNNTWYWHTATAFDSRQFGAPGDVLVPMDLGGDGKTELMVFRPSTSQWFWLKSDDQTLSSVSFGQPGDVPFAARGTGKGDTFAVYRPSDGKIRLMNSKEEFSLGGGNAIPVHGDFDGDGVQDFGVYDPTNFTWRIARIQDGKMVGTSTVVWGQDGDIPVPADYDGDGKTDVAIWRPAVGGWYINGTTVGWRLAMWGEPGDKPVPADYDGDGRVDYAVWRPSNGVWYIISSTEGWKIQQFGEKGDQPLASISR